MFQTIKKEIQLHDRGDTCEFGFFLGETKATVLLSHAGPFTSYAIYHEGGEGEGEREKGRDRNAR